MTMVMQMPKHRSEIGLISILSAPPSLPETEPKPVGAQSDNGGVTQVPLAEVATVQIVSGAFYIYREQQQRYLPIKFSVRDRDLGGAIQEAQARIAAEVPLSTGMRMEWVGEFGNLQDAIARLKIVVPLSLILIATSPAASALAWTFPPPPESILHVPSSGMAGWHAGSTSAPAVVSFGATHCLYAATVTSVSSMQKAVPAALTTFSSNMVLPKSLTPYFRDIRAISAPCVTQDA